jgi:ABC-type lipoprotein export system ATPase subunit
VLKLDRLKKSFRGPEGKDHQVVDLPSFALDAAAQVAITGESGSGKTTLLHLIAGILIPDSGRVEVDGQCMSELGEAARDRLRARAIGYVFQTFNLLQGHTCLENVLVAMAFGRGMDRARARGLLDRMGLSNRLDHYPRQLSSGQQQRAAVARALANHPKLVLADEPTGNLDTRNGREVMRLLRESCHETGAALLVVSHDREVLSEFEVTRDFASLNAPKPEGSPPNFQPP